MKILPSLFAAALLVSALPAPALAGDCFSDPVYTIEKRVKVVIGARVRDVACMEGSVVLKTLPVGKVVSAVATTDGWIKVTDTDGVTGWVGATLLQYTDEATTPTPTPTTTPAPTVSGSLLSRVKGRILLQVESHGEAWYVNPTDNQRYYMKDGSTAYEMMRAFGLGITNADFAKLEKGASDLVSRLKGRIVLKVEDLGKAYYIHPETGKTHYLRDGAAAYEIMRSLSLGITNKDLSTLSSKTFVPLSGTPTTSAPVPVPTVPAGNNQQISVSSYQGGTIPSNIDVVELNRYWLEKINALRAAKGLRALVLDQRWVDTASEWSAISLARGEMSHTRDDGKTMHQWIDAKGLPFTVRYSANGWQTNYFTENISWGYTENSMAAAKAALDETLEMYLGEAEANGPHYRTIYHPDWNSVGAGFAFGPGQWGYKVYMTFHYGSLVQ